jgi:hypothetical protein
MDRRISAREVPIWQDEMRAHCRDALEILRQQGFGDDAEADRLIPIQRPRNEYNAH